MRGIVIVGQHPVEPDWVLADAWYQSLRARGLAKRTVSSYRQTLTQFTCWCHDNDLAVVGVIDQDVRAWLDSLDIGPRATFTYTSRLATFYRWLLLEGTIDTDPTLRVIRSTVAAVSPWPAPRDRIRAVLTPSDPRTAAMVALGAYAGLRRVEIAKLRVEDLLFRHTPPMVMISGRDGQYRLVPIHAALLATLKRLGVAKTGPIFPNPTTGAPLSAGHVGTLIAKALSKPDQRVTSDRLCQFFGAEVYRLSRDIKLTQRLVGHANASTTARYAVWLHDDAATIIDRLSI